MLKKFARLRNSTLLLQNTKQILFYKNECLSRLKSMQNSAPDNVNQLEADTVKKRNPFADKVTSTSYPVEIENENLNKEESLEKKQNPFATKEFRSVEQEDFGKAKQFHDDEERERRLKVLQLEADIAYQEGRRVPKLDFFKNEHWDHVLNLPSKSARIKYYSYLRQIQMKKDADQRKKSERAVATLQHKEELRKQRESIDHIIYGLGYTSLFLRIYDATITNWQNYRLIRAMQFSPKIVVDCSYDQFMTNREAVNAAKQLTFTFAENRAHDDPFDLHFCNVNYKSICMRNLNRFIPTMRNPEFPMNLHENCFTELFPKENLVYLTPHCRTDLEEYNPDDVYIIGAMVDTVNNEPLSLAKAKKLGLRMARLPLDHYLQWGSGSGKSLTLNQMINIMLDLKFTKDWTRALKHVPKRKIVDMQFDAVREKQNLRNRANKFNSIRVEKFLFDSEDQASTQKERKVRSHKEGMEFNLDTWGSNKRNRNRQ